MAIVLDGMGGDHAPSEVIKGALKAAEAGVEVHLVGRQDELVPLVGDQGNIHVIHAEDVVTMSDAPAEVVRRRRDSSIVVGMKREGAGVPFVSAGNTGACMAVALFVLGRIPGIKRPPIASIFPQVNGGCTVVLDVGANVDCTPDNLVNFARMGTAFYRVMFDVAEPTVGLLSNGEEDSKGNSLVTEANGRLKESGLNFIGNVEGFDTLNGRCNVIVCDGFVGNVLLKATEGVSKAFHKMIKASLPEDKSQIGPDFQKLLKTMAVYDPSNQEHSGAPLLGIKGNCYIVHGSADAQTIYGACLNAEKLGKSDLVEMISKEIRG